MDETPRNLPIPKEWQFVFNQSRRIDVPCPLETSHLTAMPKKRSKNMNTTVAISPKLRAIIQKKGMCIYGDTDHVVITSPDGNKINAVILNKQCLRQQSSNDIPQDEFVWFEYANRDITKKGDVFNTSIDYILRETTEGIMWIDRSALAHYITTKVNPQERTTKPTEYKLFQKRRTTTELQILVPASDLIRDGICIDFWIW